MTLSQTWRGLADGRRGRELETKRLRKRREVPLNGSSAGGLGTNHSNITGADAGERSLSAGTART
jgi:hypothetical protein